MKFNVFFLIYLFTIALMAQPQFERSASSVASFNRMGFGTRGIALGNSISAVKQGNVSSYYNPATSVFQQENFASTGYSFLSHDRTLNFVGFTRKFDLYSRMDTVDERKPRSTAGLSIAFINAGVSKIDARDNQGFKLKELSTSENLVILGVGIKFSEKLSFGLNTKFYYYKLYEDITSTSFGVDIGFVYSYNDKLSFSLVLSDLNSKYKFDTTPIYSTEGSATEHQLPLSKKIGGAYNFQEWNLIFSGEYVFDNFGRKVLRFGSEYVFNEYFTIRAGLDNIFISNSDVPVRPALGFSFLQDVIGIKLSFDYAYSYEPYSAYDRHIVGLNFVF